MNQYLYNEKQENEMIVLMRSIKNGLRPVVIINDEIFEDAYLENQMMARIIDVSLDDELSVAENPDLIYEFTLDFSEFKDSNQKLETNSYYDSDGNPILTSSEAGYRPKNLKESVCHSINHGSVFFSLVKNEFIDEYLSTNLSQSYTGWLENELTLLRKK
jgi:hypothetical protein